MNEKIADVALRYLNYGWSILPVKPEEKRPILQNWVQYSKVRPTIENINSWFNNLSGVGIGMVTGRISNIVVLDIEHDCPYPINDILKRYPTHMISRSGSGGWHLYYQYPTNVPRVANRVGIFEKIDLRADGGFIVLPPTIHPCGNQYKWVEEGAPGTFPMGLLDLKSQPTTQGEGWVTETLRGTLEGGRNDACARLAGYFFKKGINYDIVESLLLEWNERNSPPLPVREVRNTIKSIERSHVIQGEAFTSVEYIDDREEAKQAKSQAGFDLIKMKDYISGYGGNGTSWLVQDWLPDKSITFLVAPPESYKTWMLLDLATSVASGMNFLGQFKVNTTGAVMIIQQEDSHAGIAERLSLIINSKMGNHIQINNDNYEMPVEPDLPIYIHPSRLLRFDNKKILEELEEQIKLIMPKVVIIDPLYSVVNNDNYMAQGAEQMMVLKTWRDKYGCSFLIAHHSKKNVDPDSTAREDGWGSQFLNAFLEAGWQIRRNQKLAPNEVIVRRHSKTMGNQSPVSVTFNISTNYPLQYAVSINEYQPPASNKPAQNGLFELFKGQPKSQTEIMNATGKSRSTISRQIKQMEMAGSIEKMPDGRYKVKEIE